LREGAEPYNILLYASYIASSIGTVTVIVTYIVTEKWGRSYTSTSLQYKGSVAPCYNTVVVKVHPGIIPFGSPNEEHPLSIFKGSFEHIALWATTIHIPKAIAIEWINGEF
jgi:hypothetical protein